MYTTDNIAVAAALKLLGFRIKGIEIHEKHGTFLFEGGSDVAQKVLDGTLKFSAIAIHGEIRSLSGLLRSMISNQG